MLAGVERTKERQVPLVNFGMDKLLAGLKDPRKTMRKVFSPQGPLC